MPLFHPFIHELILQTSTVYTISHLAKATCKISCTLTKTLQTLQQHHFTSVRIYNLSHHTVHPHRSVFSHLSAPTFFTSTQPPATFTPLGFHFSLHFHQQKPIKATMAFIPAKKRFMGMHRGG